MAAHLYESHIIGPIHSRRLGTSLGINILPLTTKFCTFECIYCECGFTPKGNTGKFADPTELHQEVEDTLLKMKANNVHLDSITFSGNGEPTFHPQFESIINDIIQLRDCYFPSCQISVLSNATQLHRPDVVRALQRIDNNILKLDAGINETAIAIDQPNSIHYNVKDIAQQLLQFNGNFTLQTIFLRGEVDGRVIDNTIPEEVEAWMELVERTNPKQIMIYSIDRDTPVQTLQKVSKEEMNVIAEQLRAKGFSVLVAG